jgi:hypothetical protein
VRIYSGADLQWCGFTVVRISMDFQTTLDKKMF